MLYHVLHFVTHWPHYNRYFFNYAVGIFALKWGDHRRDARFNYVSNSQYQYLPAFPYTFSVTDPANSANVFNYPLTNTQANMLANNMIEDRIHPLDPH